MKFGKLAKRNDRHYRTLQIQDYLPALPAPPLSTGNLARTYKEFGVTGPKSILPMDGNDVLGCCTIAALAHFATTARAFVGRQLVPSAAQVRSLYFQLTGGADSGLDMLTVCKYIRQNSWLGEAPILAFAEVDITNEVLLKQCISLFGPLYVGFQVQANCIQEFDAGGPWTAGPLTQDGHCVNLVDYEPGSLKAETWGSVIEATWGWQKVCVDEAYVLLPAEAATPSYIPGLNTAQLLADLKAVTA